MIGRTLMTLVFQFDVVLGDDVSHHSLDLGNSEKAARASEGAYKHANQVVGHTGTLTMPFFRTQRTNSRG